MTFAPDHAALLLDQVVTELESGRPPTAVLLLAGLLDAVAIDPTAVAAYRRLIARHPVRRFLGAQSPALLAQTTPSEDLTAWERELHAAVSQLGFVRGLRARRELGARAIEQAWRHGKRIALLDCGELGELDRLEGRALDNVTLIHGDRQAAEWIAARHVAPLAIRDPAISAAVPFDLLIATAWPDLADANELTQHLGGIAALLADGGTLLLSAFAPGHLGRGWQAVCMRRDLSCHDEAGLTAAARTAGLSITHYRDTSGSLIWAALQHADAACAPQGGPLWTSPPPSAL